MIYVLISKPFAIFLISYQEIAGIKINVMKLLFITPLIIVAAISGYNLLYTADSLFLLALHFVVFFICASAIVLLARSMFSLQVTEVENSGEGEAMPQDATAWQHV